MGEDQLGQCFSSDMLFFLFPGRPVTELPCCLFLLFNAYTVTVPEG